MSRAEPPQTVEIAAGIYAYVQLDGSWFLNNTGFLVGDQGVIAIDASSTEARTRALISAIAEVSAQPVRTLVNTHHHGDHTNGNYLFTGATIVGHDRVREVMLNSAPAISRPYWTPVEWGAIEQVPPFLTYADGVTLWRDDLRVDCRYVGTPAHTTNDSILWIPDHAVLFAGDLLFNGGTPFVMLGSVAGAIKAVESLRDLGARTIVPGHGRIVYGAAECTALIDYTLGYLRFVRDRAAEAHAAGLTPLDAARQTDLGEYANLLDRERIVGNLHRAYTEIDGGPFDETAAFTDMVTYNGGKLSAHA